MTAVAPGVVEVRFYTARDGRRDELVAYMDEVVIPFNEERGVEVIGAFVDTENPDTYVWLRRFADEDERTRLRSAVYDDPAWERDIAPTVRELMDPEKAVITTTHPTAGSALQ